MRLHNRIRQLAFTLLLLFGLGGLSSTPASAGQASMSAAVPVDAELLPPPAIPEDWRSQEGLYARIHAHPADAATARHLARHAEEAIPRIGRELGVPPGGPIDIYVAPSAAAFDQMQPGRPPDWADGTAWPRRGLIFLHSPRARSGTASPLTQVLDHEIAHIVLGRAFGPRPVPRWLQEGTAQLVAKEYSPETTQQLSAGVLGGTLLSLDEITRGFPLDPLKAQLAYAQSADLVAFIRNEYGAEAFQTLVFEMARGRTVQRALHEATGLTMTRLDQKWRGRLTGSGIGLSALVNDTVILGGAGIAFVVLGFAALRRRKARLEEMGREDALQDALYAALAGDWGDHPPLPPQPVPPRFRHPEAPEGGEDWIH